MIVAEAELAIGDLGSTASNDFFREYQKYDQFDGVTAMQTLDENHTSV